MGGREAIYRESRGVAWHCGSLLSSILAMWWSTISSWSSVLHACDDQGLHGTIITGTKRSTLGHQVLSWHYRCVSALRCKAMWWLALSLAFLQLLYWLIPRRIEKYNNNKKDNTRSKTCMQARSMSTISKSYWSLLSILIVRTWLDKILSLLVSILNLSALGQSIQ